MIGRRGAVLLVAVVVVAACTSAARPQPISARVAGELTVRAVRRACPACGERTTFVRDALLKSDTLLGDELPMPADVRTALVAGLGAVLVTRDEATGLFDDEGALPDGGIVVTVGPIEDLAPGVVGIDVGIARHAFDYRAQTVLFRWERGQWHDATPDEIGVTVTSAVS